MKRAVRAARSVALALFAAVLVTGCGDTIRYDAGTRPNTDLLDGTLKLGTTTKAEVRAAIGEPVGKGGFMLPVIDAAPRDTWTYYYEDSYMKAAQGGIEWVTARIFLFVYFDQDRYDGYMWFSSLPGSGS